MAGYTVLEAAKGDEALQLLESFDGQVDLMFTDMVMPGMSGTELAERLADIRPRMKVLFVSGYTDDQVLRDGLLNASSHFIGKPYSVTQLTSKVREVLDK
jgi:CheY-like chemotaxis protein